VVFLSFPFEDVKTSEPDPNNQKTLIARVLSWFDQPSGIEEGEIRRLALARNVPNPFNPCLLYTSPSPRDVEESRMPSSA